MAEIKTKFRVGGRWTRKQLAELLLVGPAPFDEPKGEMALLWIKGELSPTTHDKSLGECALDLVENHPQHLLVLVDYDFDPKAKWRSIRVLGETCQPYTIWQATLDQGCELRSYPEGVSGPCISYPTDRDGHRIIFGAQLRELRRQLVEGHAARALGLLDEFSPPVPQLPPFELVE
jgi:hypothetical protein